MTVWLLSTCALIAALMLLRRALRGRMDPAGVRPVAAGGGAHPGAGVPV